MNLDLDDFLTATAPQTRNKSHVSLLLEALDDEKRARVLAELRSDRESAWLGRALTQMAHAAGVIPTDRRVSAQAVRDWRASHGPR